MGVCICMYVCLYCICVVVYVRVFVLVRMCLCAALQTALRLLGEGKSSLHEELKLKRRVQRERSQRGRNLSTCSNSSDLSGQSDDSSYQETDEDRERHNQQIDSIIQVREGLAAGGRDFSSKRRLCTL